MITAHAAGTTTTAPASILDLEGNGTFKAALTGKQNEYIYFGDNAVFDGYGNSRTGAIKWRVLSTGSDNKYSKGNMLLWADYQLFTSALNPAHTDSGYAFWGTSQLRADLNGGEYASPSSVPVLDQKVQESVSWQYALFKADDINAYDNKAVVAADSYTTDSWSIDTRLTQYLFLRDGIAAAGGGNGIYDTDDFGSGTAKNASTTAKNGVQESAEGDKLFLLDYYDVNNANYGFADGGTTYADYVSDNTWTTSTNYFPGYYDDSGRKFNNLNSACLFYSGDLSGYYWLRNPGRTSDYHSEALVVGASGHVWGDYQTQKYGVRPAFNLKADNVAYATSANLGAEGSFAAANVSADSKPAYKLYLTNGSLNKSGKANVREENNNLYLTYNKPVGNNDGKLLLLLTNKTTQSVDYQATLAMSAQATATQQVATDIALPSGASLSTHDVALLYASDNGDNFAESVYCSYSFDSGIDAPQNIAVNYDGGNKWITNLTSSEKPAWLDLGIYNNTSYVKVDKIEYTAPNAASAVEVASSNMKTAGDYKVYMSLASGLKWTDGTEGQKWFIITIKGKKSTPIPKIDPPLSGIPFVTDGMPTLVADIAKGSTDGTFVWKTGETPKAGIHSYEWVFTPKDSNFTVESDTMELEFQQREITGISVKSYSETSTVYTNTPLTTIKGYFTIEATYSDNRSEDLSSTDFKVTIKAADGKLVKGQNTLIISTSDDRFPIQFNIDVQAVEVSSISLVRMSKTQFTYPVTAEEIKKAITSVTVVWNNGSSGPLGDLSILTVSGTLNAGANVEITFGVDGLTLPPYTENINIDKGTYTDIKFENATFTEVAGKTYTSDDFKATGVPAGVTVTYYYKDAPFTGASAAGTYEITAKFAHSDPNYEPIEDMTATLKIVSATIVDITATVGGEADITVENTLDDLKEFITVTVNLTGNNTSAATEFELSCDSLREGGLFEVGAQEVTVTYAAEDGKEYTCNVAVTVKKAKVELPVYLNTLSYTGGALAVSAADFSGFDGGKMSLVTEKLPAEIKNAGAYKVVFAITAPARYEWNKTAAHSVKPFRLAVAYDGGAAEPALDDNEVAIELNVAKAVVSATKEAGKLPVFSSKSYKGSWADAIRMRYYADQNCMSEVAADSLEDDKQYYVKVELVDEANFALDESLSDFTITPFPYKTPAHTAGAWDKVVSFIKTNWLLLLIILIVLILIIVIVSIIKHAARKRREREEERRQEERDERMRRYMQSQVSQYVPMSQLQGMPMGGATVSPELMAILSGMNAKIEMLQSGVAALPPASPQTDSASPELLELISGMNAKIDKLQSEVEASVKSARGSERVANANAAAEPARPPERVGITPRTGLGSRPLVEPQPRGFTAQQPEDDDKVVDWGGFYNLADEEDMEDVIIFNADKSGKK